MTPVRGEVWLFDLGMHGKVRPALVISVAYTDLDRALVTIVPHTTSFRGSQYEIAVNVNFLNAGALLVQNVATDPSVRAIRNWASSRRTNSISFFPACLAGWDTSSRSYSALTDRRFHHYFRAGLGRKRHGVTRNRFAIHDQ